MARPGTLNADTSGAIRGPDFAALLASVEAAEGPDRALDALVVCALLAPKEAYVERSKINGNWCIYEFGPHDRARLWETPSPFRQLPGVTASLDAALALCERVLGRDRTECLAQEAFGSTRYLSTLASAFALALLAAMLKALIAQGEADTSDRLGIPGKDQS